MPVLKGAACHYERFVASRGEREDLSIHLGANQGLQDTTVEWKRDSREENKSLGVVCKLMLMTKMQEEE